MRVLLFLSLRLDHQRLWMLGRLRLLSRLTTRRRLLHQTLNRAKPLKENLLLLFLLPFLLLVHPVSFSHLSVFVLQLLAVLFAPIPRSALARTSHQPLHPSRLGHSLFRCSTHRPTPHLLHVLPVVPWLLCLWVVVRANPRARPPPLVRTTLDRSCRRRIPKLKPSNSSMEHPHQHRPPCRRAATQHAALHRVHHRQSPPHLRQLMSWHHKPLHKWRRSPSSHRGCHLLHPSLLRPRAYPLQVLQTVQVVS